MNSLVFLTNGLQSPSKQRQIKIPMEYLGVGIMKAKMYRNGRETFCAESNNRRYGNKVVYGSLYYVQNFEHYSLALDALHDCSLSLIGREHNLDLQKRVQRDIIMLNVESINDLLNLNYTEGSIVQSNVYLANTTHPNITKRIHKKSHVYRVESGIRSALAEQWEETHGTITI